MKAVGECCSKCDLTIIIVVPFAKNRHNAFVRARLCCTAGALRRDCNSKYPNQREISVFIGDKKLRLFSLF